MDCSSLISIPDISKWNTKNIYFMGSLFFNCSSLISLPDITKWDIVLTNAISTIFNGCSSLISLPDISKWNFNFLTEINGFFNGCSSLISLPDISKWNIKNIKTISSLFANCSSLISIPDISKWNTKNVKNMDYLFYGCSSLTSLPNIEKWSTDNLEEMNYIFSGCSSLISLPDISKWKTDKIKEFKNIFYGCYSLMSLPDISNWELNIYNNIITITGMYTDCLSLIYLPKTFRAYKPNQKRKNKERFDDNESIIKLEKQLAEKERLNKTLSKKLETEINKRKLQDQKILQLKEDSDNYVKEYNDLQQKWKELITKNNVNNKQKIKSSNNDQSKIQKDKTEIPFYVGFISADYEQYYSFECKKNDLVYKVEGEIYKMDEELKNYDLDLTLNGKRIKKFKTLQENGI